MATKELSETKPKDHDPGRWRDLVAFWILGLCNNYGYTVMLSAAHDIIGEFQEKKETKEIDATDRNCHILSTGVILLADVIPELIMKTLIPFLPMWYFIYIGISIAFTFISFLIVAFATAEWMAIIGVCVTSASVGIGECVFLAYSSHFHKYVVSTWSSGTGAASVIGSTSYATLTTLGLNRHQTLLVMLIIPTIETLAFTLLLRHPDKPPEFKIEGSTEIVTDDKPLVGFKEKILFIPNILHFMLPLGLVYFFQYLINQGLYELVYFENIFLDHSAQYRWFYVDYQIGVFISRSTVTLFHVNKTWLLATLQLVTLVFFIGEVIFYFTPSIWIIFAIVFGEGLVGGGTYVNTFYRMSKEMPPYKRRFALTMVIQSATFGVAMAGCLSMPIHNAICKLPQPERGF